MKTRTPFLTVITALIVSTFLLSSWQTETWEKVLEQDGVVVSSASETVNQDGIEKEYVVLRIENTTGQRVMVSWYLENWYGGVCRSCSLDRPNEYNKVIYLGPGQVVSGLGEKEGSALRIFSSFPGKPATSALSAFELADFTVEAQ